MQRTIVLHVRHSPDVSLTLLVMMMGTDAPIAEARSSTVDSFTVELVKAMQSSDVTTMVALGDVGYSRQETSLAHTV